MNTQTRFDVFKIRVVADIDRRPGMQQIGEENIEVHVLRCRQRRVIRVRKQAVVLGDETQGELARELIIPLGTENVAVDDGMVCLPFTTRSRM